MDEKDIVYAIMDEVDDLRESITAIRRAQREKIMGEMLAEQEASVTGDISQE
jgi:hypothetical protein